MTENRLYQLPDVAMMIRHPGRRRDKHGIIHLDQQTSGMGNAHRLNLGFFLCVTNKNAGQVTLAGVVTEADALYSRSLPYTGAICPSLP